MTDLCVFEKKDIILKNSRNKILVDKISSYEGAKWIKVKLFEFNYNNRHQNTVYETNLLLV